MQTIQHIIVQYKITTDWFLSALNDISEEDGSKTITENSNSLEWIAGHLITGRYRNIVRLGIKIDPYKNLDKFVNPSIPPPNAIAFDKKTKYQGLAECREQWKIYSTIFLEALEKADETILQTKLPAPILTGGTTIMDALVFAALHETYHVGQMSSIRKSLGYPAMRLSPRK